MTFRYAGNGGNCVVCGWIQADGDITADTAEALRNFTKGEAKGQYLFLDSDGGNLLGGLALGREIRELGLNTDVGTTVPDGYGWQTHAVGHCVSACAFAFLGGVERGGKGSQIGVHQFFDPTAVAIPNAKIFSWFDVSDYQLEEGLLLDYVTGMGVDARLVSLASQSPPSSMHLLTDAEMDALRVDWQPHDFPAWQIEPYRSGLIAFARSKDQLVTATLFCTGRERHLLFTDMSSGAGAVPRIDVNEYQQELPIDVMGRSVAGSQIVAKRLDGGYSMDFDLGKDFIPDAKDARIGANGIPTAYAFYVWFSDTGLPEASKLAFKNCI